MWTIMLLKSDKPILDTIKIFANYGVEAAYLVPTKTGIKKGILDAHASLREYLIAKNIHNYKLQKQGTSNKKLVKCWLLDTDKKSRTKISFYRPETKSGDPRIWIYGLTKFAKPYNLISLIVFNSEIYILNVSKCELSDIICDALTPLGSLIQSMQCVKNTVAGELLTKIKEINKRGYIKSLIDGPTGIGMTLEALLGIPPNSRKIPDYKGIEIKSSRVQSKSKRYNSKVNLFSLAPDWKSSKLGSANLILEKYGYKNRVTNKLELYCTLREKPNPQGLYLHLDDQKDLLESLCQRNGSVKSVVQWSLEKLRQTLKEKHNQTFWVKARVNKLDDGTEEYHYYEIIETQNPLIENFSTLVELGVITLDFTLSLIPKKSGSGVRTRDHGYLFKIHPNNFSLLFPPSKIHVFD